MFKCDRKGATKGNSIVTDRYRLPPKVLRAVLLTTSAAIGDIAFPAAAPVATATPQDVAQADAPVTTDGVQDVIVTAQHREERLQQVPLSITALTGEESRTQTSRISTGSNRSSPASASRDPARPSTRRSVISTPRRRVSTPIRESVSTSANTCSARRYRTSSSRLTPRSTCG